MTTAIRRAVSPYAIRTRSDRRLSVRGGVQSKPADAVASLNPDTLHRLGQNEIPIEGRSSFYPVPEQEAAVKELVAKEHRVLPGDVFLSSGSSEAIITLADFLGHKGPVVLARTTFALYENRTRINAKHFGHYPAVSVELTPDGRYDLDGVHRAVERHIRDGAKPFAVVVEPNNPTGTAVGKAALLAFAKNLRPEVPLIIDFAYKAFARDVASTAQLFKAHPHSVVLATPSKQDGLAGVRAGVAITRDPALKAILRERLIPFNVSTPALDQWKTALSDEKVRAKTIRRVRESRAFFEAQNWVAFRSDTNFITVFVNKDPDFVTGKLAAQGFAIRSMSDQGPAVRGCVRVTFGTPEQNARMAELLAPYVLKWPSRTTRGNVVAEAQLSSDLRIAELLAQRILRGERS